MPYRAYPLDAPSATARSRRMTTTNDAARDLLRKIDAARAARQG